MTNTDRYMCEWYDMIVNSDMKPKIKSANLKILRNYIGMVDDIKIWIMLNRYLDNTINNLNPSSQKIIDVCDTSNILICGYCVFLTIVNLLFLDYIL